MRMDLMTLSLLMVAGTPAFAMAQGCTEAEAVLRTEAGELGPMLTQMTLLDNEYQMKQKLIQTEYDYFYYYYEVPDTSPGSYVAGLERDKIDIKAEYDALLTAVTPRDARVAQLVTAYETACGANAKPVELLKEYEIVILPKPQGQ